LLFKQIKHSGDNFSYVVADANTKEAAVVDPGFNADRIIPFLKDHGLKAKYVIATHHHGDHTAGNEKVTSSPWLKPGASHFITQACQSP